jgi:hypothetical protein
VDNIAILQFHDGDLDVSASTGVYMEAIAQWGFPDTHANLVQALRLWVEMEPTTQSPQQKLERVLEVENDILIDTGIAGVAVEHLPFLYTVLGEVFEDYGQVFRQALQREALHVERVQEDAIHEQMREIGCDRLEVVPYMEDVALERLQARRERVLTLLNAHLSMI